MLLLVLSTLSSLALSSSDNELSRLDVLTRRAVLTVSDVSIGTLSTSIFSLVVNTCDRFLFSSTSTFSTVSLVEKSIFSLGVPSLILWSELSSYVSLASSLLSRTIEFRSLSFELSVVAVFAGAVVGGGAA